MTAENATLAQGKFHEASLWAAPIKDMALAIEGTRLEPILAEFEREREAAGFRRVRPRYYLSTEWGVPFATVAIAIPFYLARPELTTIHSEEIGFVEGIDPGDILRYLRHEFGHVVNYAYQLYEREDWVKTFGSITQPYVEDYRPVPFSTRHVNHLPGWYAQKHPDEDWAETFAVWMSGANWAADYAAWPVALAKLQFADRLLKSVRDTDPKVTATDLDEDVGQLPYTLEHYYRQSSGDPANFPPGLDGALCTIFNHSVDDGKKARKPASELIRRLERPLMANIYRWTGHFPERTRELLRFLAGRADALKQVYAEERETSVVTGLTTLVTSLAMNYVVRGTYLP